MYEPAERTHHVKYAIRNVVAEAKKLEAAGRKILYLNVGDPLKYDFPAPPHLIEAVHRAMRDGHNGYAPSAGIPGAREAIAAEATRRGIQDVSPEDVIVTAGASEAIEMAMTALLNPGDSVLLPSPGYPLYNAVAGKIGAEVIPYYLDEERGWSLNLAELDAAVGPRTKAVVVGNPNNPTGAVYDRETLLGLLEIARRRKLVVLSDEIYDKLVYDRPHVATASLATDVPVLTFNGLSKAYLACGWRIGWVVFGHSRLAPELRAAAMRLADARLCAPAPAQHAIAPALEGPQDHIPTMMRKLRQRRDLVVSRLNAIHGISVVAPEGAFYMMPRVQLPGVTSDEAFVLQLLRESGVLFVHGSGFGQKPGTHHFRVVYLPQPEVLESACDLLDTFVRKHFLAEAAV